MSGRSSTSGAIRAAASTAPIAVFTMNWLTVPGVRPSGPASGEAATKNATSAISAIGLRRLAILCGHPTSVTVNSANSMPAANHAKNAGGQFRGLVPRGVRNGISPQARLANPTATMTGMRARTGSRRASSARNGSAR
ncbi:MAG: hypothetical protein NVS4B6_15560 [Mycobacterium sp.]